MRLNMGAQGYLDEHVFFAGQQIIFIIVHLDAGINYIAQQFFVVRYASQSLCYKQNHFTPSAQLYVHKKVTVCHFSI